MPTYTNLGIKKITTGDEAGTWGDSTNTNFDYFDTAIVGYVSIALTSSHTSGAPYDLNVADFLASDGRNRVIEFIGTPGVDTYVQITPNDFEGYYFVRNSVAGGYSVFVFQTNSYDAAKDIEIPNGKDFIIRCDGAGSTAAVVSSVIDNPQFTTVDTTTLEVTNIKAKDGTSAGTIANSTGIVTLNNLEAVISNGRATFSLDSPGGNNAAVLISKTNATGDTNPVIGVSVSFKVSSDSVNAACVGFQTNPTIQDSSFTLGAFYGFSTGGIYKDGSSPTVNTQYGFSVSGLTAATNNYGFYGNVASATGRWNFYAAGTAPNYFEGNTTFNQAVTINGTTTVDILDATTVNKVTFTAPATSATLTIADGKTATVNNSITFSGTDSTTMTFPDENASIGFRNVPQNSQSADYTLVLSDSGKHIFRPSADTGARTFTIPSNASVVYPIGTAITFVNYSVDDLSIASSNTMRLAGTGATGTRTLARWGVATALKTGSTTWIISGTGLT